MILKDSLDDDDGDDDDDVGVEPRYGRVWTLCSHVPPVPNSRRQ